MPKNATGYAVIKVASETYLQPLNAPKGVTEDGHKVIKQQDANQHAA